MTSLQKKTCFTYTSRTMGIDLETKGDGGKTGIFPLPTEPNELEEFFLSWFALVFVFFFPSSSVPLDLALLRFLLIVPAVLPLLPFFVSPCVEFFPPFTAVSWCLSVFLTATTDGGFGCARQPSLCILLSANASPLGGKIPIVLTVCPVLSVLEWPCGKGKWLGTMPGKPITWSREDGVFKGDVILCVFM